MRRLSIALALSLTLFRVIYGQVIGLNSAFAEDATAAIVSVDQASVDASSGTPVRLAILEAPKGEANSTRWAAAEGLSLKHSKVRVAGACPGSRYTCGAHYPYCCYSENRGYYCREDAKHC